MIRYAEDGCPFGDVTLAGSIWAPLPDDYKISFMELTEDDWR